MLRKVKLYGELAKFVGHEEFEVQVDTVGKAISFLIHNFPGIESYMSPKYYQVKVGNYAIDKDEIGYPIGKEDIHFIPVISGAGGNFGKIVLGAALIGIGMASGGITFASFFNPAVVPFAPGFASAGLLTKATIAIVATTTWPIVAFPYPSAPPKKSSGQKPYS